MKAHTLKLLAAGLTAAQLLQYAAFADGGKTDYTAIYANAHEFASRYEYHEGDAEKSMALYPDIPYTSGIDTADDGTEYECPAIYDNRDAFEGSNLTFGVLKLMINGVESDYSSECVLYNNGTTLLPAEVFESLGCTVNFDEALDVTEISNETAVLEILPYLIGMRKNKADGYYVPLAVCARFINGTVYVPARAIAFELGIAVGWDPSSSTVMLDNEV